MTAAERARVIRREHLRRGLAKVIRHGDGSVNSVLAMWKPAHRPDAGSAWLVSNTLFYNAHLNCFHGYMPLEEP